MLADLAVFMTCWSTFAFQLGELMEAKIFSSPIDRCGAKNCFAGGCSNDVIVTEQPIVINSPKVRCLRRTLCGFPF